MNDILQKNLVVGAPPSSASRKYRPWSKGRVWSAFILGMHAAFFMSFFFFPVFAVFGFASGLAAVILTGIEIRNFPEARMSGPVKWARITGFVGLIGGPVALFLFTVIFVIFAGAAIPV
jgi:hypothetical protein